MPTTSASAEGSPQRYVTIRAPEHAWELLHETLQMDAQSKAFDAELRKDIAEALAQVEVLPAGSASDALRRIFDRLYLDMTPEGDVHTTDKHWDGDTLADVAEIVRPFFEHHLGDGVEQSHAETETTSAPTSSSTAREGDRCL